MIDFEKLAIFSLSKGKHESAAEGVCAMEAVAWLEGLEHTDAPACTCPVIAAYVRVMNDKLSDMDRQRLVAYLPRLVGTVGDLEVAVERGLIFAQAAGEVFAAGSLRKIRAENLAERVSDVFRRRDWENARRAALDLNSADLYPFLHFAASVAGAASQIEFEVSTRNFYAASEHASDSAFYSVEVSASGGAPVSAFLEVLDLALAHGPQSPLRFSQPMNARVADYARLVGAEAEGALLSKIH